MYLIVFFLFIQAPLKVNSFNNQVNAYTICVLNLGTNIERFQKGIVCTALEINQLSGKDNWLSTNWGSESELQLKKKPLGKHLRC